MKGSFLKWFVFFSAIFSGLTGNAQQRYEFSVLQAVDYARKNNTQVKNALIGIESQKQLNREITAAA